MNKIECNFCKKTNLFDDTKMRKSGKGLLITCEYCKRAIWCGYNNDIYYEKVVDKSDKV